MPSLDDLKKRIKSVKSTQKITKAMKMVAAAKLRRAQESAEKGRPFSEKMNNIILNLSNSISDKDNASKFLVGTGKDTTHLCVVITADRGLCGGFNTNICRKARNYFNKILHLYFFFNLIIGARTGPKTFTSFIFGSLDLMFIANFIIKGSFFPEIIKDISR